MSKPISLDTKLKLVRQHANKNNHREWIVLDTNSIDQVDGSPFYDLRCKVCGYTVGVSRGQMLRGGCPDILDRQWLEAELRCIGEGP